MVTLLVHVVSLARHRPELRFARRLGEALTVIGATLSRWRNNSRQRSELFRAPASVRKEVLDRGLKVESETKKPFWRS